jgi:hypothetical protein
MEGKITLITPPDIFENNNPSILFFHLSEQDQDAASKWFSNTDVKTDVNLYVYSGEENLPWLFYAMGRCEHKYLDLDGLNFISNALSGYILGRSNTYYKTDNENLAAIYSHINSNRVKNIETFLESVLIG